MQWICCNEIEAERRKAYLFLVDATDGITPELGEAGGQPQISKNGGAFVNTAGILVSIGYGAYYVQLEQGEISERGFVIIRYKSANTAEFQSLIQVMSQTRFGTKML